MGDQKSVEELEGGNRFLAVTEETFKQFVDECRSLETRIKPSTLSSEDLSSLLLRVVFAYPWNPAASLPEVYHTPAFRKRSFSLVTSSNTLEYRPKNHVYIIGDLPKTLEEVKSFAIGKALNESILKHATMDGALHRLYEDFTSRGLPESFQSSRLSLSWFNTFLLRQSDDGLRFKESFNLLLKKNFHGSVLDCSILKIIGAGETFPSSFLFANHRNEFNRTRSKQTNGAPFRITLIDNINEQVEESAELIDAYGYDDPTNEKANSIFGSSSER